MRHSALSGLRRFVLPLPLLAALAGCGAVQRVQGDMERDWNKFRAEVLNDKPSGAQQTARRGPARPTAAPAPAKTPDAQIAARPQDVAGDAELATPAPKPVPLPAKMAEPPSAAPRMSESLRLALAKDYAVGGSSPEDRLVADAIRAAAESGDAQASCNIGMRYVNGRGVERDWSEGEKWLRRAAGQGYAPAQTNLAMLLASEQNPQANTSEALMWASKAANAGYGPARAQLGMMYATGRGVTQDDRMADFWLASARREMREPPGSCAPPPAKDTLTAR